MALDGVMTSCDVDNCWIATEANAKPLNASYYGIRDLKRKNSTKSPRHPSMTAKP
jgi:hypothetical protein